MSNCCCNAGNCVMCLIVFRGLPNVSRKKRLEGYVRINSNHPRVVPLSRMYFCGELSLWIRSLGREHSCQRSEARRVFFPCYLGVVAARFKSVSSAASSFTGPRWPPGAGMWLQVCAVNNCGVGPTTCQERRSVPPIISAVVRSL